MYRKMGGASTQNTLKHVIAPTVMCVWIRIASSSSFPSGMYRPNDKKIRKESVRWKCGSDSLDKVADVALRTSSGIPATEDSWSEKSGGKRCGTGEQAQDTHRPLARYWILPQTPPTNTFGCLSAEPRQTLESFSIQWAVQARVHQRQFAHKIKPSGASIGEKDKITH